MLPSEQNLIETVKALPAERQEEVRDFIGLLSQSEEIVAAAMMWIAAHLPDRYCAGEPRFEIRAFGWQVPVLLSYPNGKHGLVGELVFDSRTHELRGHTSLEEIQERGRKLVQEFMHA